MQFIYRLIFQQRMPKSVKSSTLAFTDPAILIRIGTIGTFTFTALIVLCFLSFLLIVISVNILITWSRVTSRRPHAIACTYPVIVSSADTKICSCKGRICKGQDKNQHHNAAQFLRLVHMYPPFL